VRALLDRQGDGARGELLDWLEAPEASHWEQAGKTLTQIGAVVADRLTPLGRRLLRYPVHPKLARVLLAAGEAGVATLACAMVALMESSGRKSRADDADLHRLGLDLVRRLRPLAGSARRRRLIGNSCG
jgi:ATP-dependent helicase HrpB